MGYDKVVRGGATSGTVSGEGFDPFADGGHRGSAVMTGGRGGGTVRAKPIRRRREGGGIAADLGRDRGAGAPRGGGMPAQVVGTGQGKVKFFNTQKGFGFIQRDEGGEDVFVHISQVERAGLEGLAEGQELQFNLVDRGGKISAADLQVVGDVIKVSRRPRAAA